MKLLTFIISTLLVSIPVCHAESLRQAIPSYQNQQHRYEQKQEENVENMQNSEQVKQRPADTMKSYNKIRNHEEKRIKNKHPGKYKVNKIKNKKNHVERIRPSDRMKKQRYEQYNTERTQNQDRFQNQTTDTMKKQRHEQYNTERTQNQDRFQNQPTDTMKEQVTDGMKSTEQMQNNSVDGMQTHERMR